MRRTRRTTAPAAPIQQRQRFVPTWYVERRGHVHYSSQRVPNLIDMVLAGHLRLPRFQRPWRWSDAQVIELLDSLLRGFYVGQLLLWEHLECPASAELFGEVEVKSPAGACHLVVDGQQRLAALATAACSGRFCFDLQDGHADMKGPGPWRVDAGLVITNRTEDGLDWTRAHAAEHGLDPLLVRDGWAAAHRAFGSAEIAATELPACWPLEAVVQTYQRINTTGTPMAPADLEAGLQRAVDGA